MFADEILDYRNMKNSNKYILQKKRYSTNQFSEAPLGGASIRPCVTLPWRQEPQAAVESSPISDAQGQVPAIVLKVIPAVASR